MTGNFSEDVRRIMQTPTFLGLDTENRNKVVSGFRDEFIAKYPGQAEYFNEVAENAQVGFLRSTGQGRYVPTEFNTQAPWQSEGWDLMSEDEKSDEIEKYKTKIPEIANQDRLNKGDIEFYLDQVSDAQLRKAKGEDTGWIMDKGYRAFDGFAAGMASYVGAEDTAAAIRRSSSENPKYDTDLTATLAQGAGDMVASTAIFVGASLAGTAVTGNPIAGGYTGTTATLATNAISRYNDAYRQGIERGLSDEESNKAGWATMPGAAIDALGDKLIAGKFLPNNATQVFKKGSDLAKRELLAEMIFDKTKRGILLNTAKDAFAEGVTEAGGDLVAGAGAFLATGDRDYIPKSEDLRDSFLVGAILGGAVAGVTDSIKATGPNKEALNKLQPEVERLTTEQPTDEAAAQQIWDLMDQGKYKEAYELSSKIETTPYAEKNDPVTIDPLININSSVDSKEVARFVPKTEQDEDEVIETEDQAIAKVEKINERQNFEEEVRKQYDIYNDVDGLFGELGNSPSPETGFPVSGLRVGISENLAGLGTESDNFAKEVTQRFNNIRLVQPGTTTSSRGVADFSVLKRSSPEGEVNVQASPNLQTKVDEAIAMGRQNEIASIAPVNTDDAAKQSKANVPTININFPGVVTYPIEGSTETETWLETPEAVNSLIGELNNKFGVNNWVVKDSQGAAGQGIYVGEKMLRQAASENKDGLLLNGLYAEGYNDNLARREEGGDQRVHIIKRGGQLEVVPYATHNRNNSLPYVARTPAVRGIEEAALKYANAAKDSIAEGGMMGVDVVIGADKSLIATELNPTQYGSVADAYDGHGSSGFASTPYVQAAIYSHLKGRVPAFVLAGRKILRDQLTQQAIAQGSPRIALKIQQWIGNMSDEGQLRTQLLQNYGELFADYTHDIWTAFKDSAGRITQQILDLIQKIIDTVMFKPVPANVSAKNQQLMTQAKAASSIKKSIANATTARAIPTKKQIATQVKLQPLTYVAVKARNGLELINQVSQSSGKLSDLINNNSGINDFLASIPVNYNEQGLNFFDGQSIYLDDINDSREHELTHAVLEYGLRTDKIFSDSVNQSLQEVISSLDPKDELDSKILGYLKRATEVTGQQAGARLSGLLADPVLSQSINTNFGLTWDEFLLSYGLSSPSEFVAAVFSSEQFRSFINRPQRKGAFQKFLDAIKKFFTGKTSKDTITKITDNIKSFVSNGNFAVSKFDIASLRGFNYEFQSFSEESSIAAAEANLSPEEKSIAANELGFTEWTKTTAKAFSSKMADWLVSIKGITNTLSDLFTKVWNAIRNPILISSVALSVNSGTVFSPSISVSEVVRNNIAPVTSVDFSAIELGFDRININFNRAIDSATSTFQEVNRASRDLMKYAVDSIPKQPKLRLNGTPASDDVKTMATWIIRQGDNKGKSFLVADKKEGTMYFFSSEGELLKKSPALFGSAVGDNISEDQSNRTIEESRVNKSEQITPAGRFTGTLRNSSEYGNLIDFLEQDKTVLAIHKVFLGRPEERRIDRLNSESAIDNRISLGCINLPESAMKNIAAKFDDGGSVYILPETVSGSSVFNGFNELQKKAQESVNSPSRPGERRMRLQMLKDLKEANIDDKFDSNTSSLLATIKKLKATHIDLIAPFDRARVYELIENIYKARKEKIKDPQARINTAKLLEELESYQALIDATAIENRIQNLDKPYDLSGYKGEDGNLEQFEAYINRLDQANADFQEKKRNRNEKAKATYEQKMTAWRSAFADIRKTVLEKYPSAEAFLETYETDQGSKVKGKKLRDFMMMHYDYLTSLADTAPMIGKNLYRHFFALNNLLDGSFMHGTTTTVEYIKSLRDGKININSLEGKFRDPVINQGRGFFGGLDAAQRATEIAQTQLGRWSAFIEAKDFLQQDVMGPLLESIIIEAKNAESASLRQYEAAKKNFEKETGREMTGEDRVVMSLTSRLIQFATGKDGNKEFIKNIKNEWKNIFNIVGNPNDPNPKKRQGSGTKSQINDYVKVVIPVYEQLIAGLTESPNPMEQFMANLNDRIGLGDAAIGEQRAKLLSTMQEIMGEYTLDNKVVSEMFYNKPFTQYANYLPRLVIPINPEQYNAREGSIADEMSKFDDQYYQTGSLTAEPGQIKERDGIGNKGHYSQNIEYIFSRGLHIAALTSATTSERHILNARLKDGPIRDLMIGSDSTYRVDQLQQWARQVMMHAMHSGQPLGTIGVVMKSINENFARVALSGLHQGITQTMSGFADYYARTGNIVGAMQASGHYIMNKEAMDKFFTENAAWIGERSFLGEQELDRRRTIPIDEGKIRNSPAVKWLSKFHDKAGDIITFSLRHGDDFTARALVLAEYTRLLGQKNDQVQSINDVDFSTVEGNILSEAILNVEQNINASNKATRGEFFVDRHRGMAFLRNITVAFSSHVMMLAGQFNIAIRDLVDLQAAGGSSADKMRAIRTIGAILGQTFTFSTGRYVINGAMAAAMIGLLKDLFDDDEGKIAKLDERVRYATDIGDDVMKTHAQNELKTATMIRKQIDTFSQRQTGFSSYWKNMLKDELNSMHFMFNGPQLPQKLVFPIFDNFGEMFMKEDQEQRVKWMKDQVQVLKDRKQFGQAAKLKEQLILIENAEYAPWHIDQFDSVGLGGITGTALNGSYASIQEFVDAAFGLNEVNMNDFILSAQAFGMGQADLNRFFKTVDKIEDEQYKLQGESDKRKEERKREVLEKKRSAEAKDEAAASREVFR